MGPDICGVQNREKGPKHFSKKGYFLHKTGYKKKKKKKKFMKHSEQLTVRKRNNPKLAGLLNPKPMKVTVYIIM